MNPKLVTIGAYGYNEKSFFEALVKANIDTFCDIRFRRGVRGSEYAFANSQRLQHRLQELGIRYLHLKDLAPSPEIREVQWRVDAQEGNSKRQRSALSPNFVAAYQSKYLADFDSAAFIQALGEDAKVVALFCVERLPEACHRSLVANQLKHDLSLDVKHLTPCEQEF